MVYSEACAYNVVGMNAIIHVRRVCFVRGQGGLGIDIHGYQDKDIHIICLVERMGRAIFLFGSMHMCWAGRAIFFGWMDKGDAVTTYPNW